MEADGITADGATTAAGTGDLTIAVETRAVRGRGQRGLILIARIIDGLQADGLGAALDFL